MELAIVRKVLTVGTLTVAVVLLGSATAPAQGTPKLAVLHATVTITGGLAFTGSYDARLPVRTCADVAKGGTGQVDVVTGGASFYVPIPPPNPGGNPGSVGGGHNFSTDAAAWPYRGPGTYTGKGVNGTELEADMRPDDQETHVFAFPTGIGTLIVNSDASGSFEFSGLEDAGSVKISGRVIWTCS
jgi:hypothetical protein